MAYGNGKGVKEQIVVEGEAEAVETVPILIDVPDVHGRLQDVVHLRLGTTIAQDVKQTHISPAIAVKVEDIARRLPGDLHHTLGLGLGLVRALDRGRGRVLGP